MNTFRLKVIITKNKCLITLVMGILCFSTLKSQCKHSIDSIIYERVYNYIITDSLFEEKSVNVSNKLTGSCYMCFFNEIKEDNKDLESCYKELYELDKKYALSDSVYPYFDEHFKKFTSSNVTLFFSMVINNGLFAEVKIGDFGIESLSESVFYYFTFDSNGNIERIYKKKMYGL